MSLIILVIVAPAKRSESAGPSGQHESRSLVARLRRLPRMTSEKMRVASLSLESQRCDVAPTGFNPQ